MMLGLGYLSRALTGSGSPRTWSRALASHGPTSDTRVKFDPVLWQDSTTFNREEVLKFRGLAEAWWDRRGPCQPLHSLNHLRVALVREGLEQTGRVAPELIGTEQALQGLRILDVGCGGGLLSEPLARLGAQVTGLDAAEENVAIAREHASQDETLRDRLDFQAITVEDYSRAHPEVRFDAVVASEVIEHVDQQPLFVQTCSHLLQDGGSLFVTTLNRTQASYWAGIVAAEYILGLLERGTHDWHKFVTPDELVTWLEAGGCETRLIQGMTYVPVVDQWYWVPVTAVNYALHAIKTAQPPPV